MGSQCPVLPLQLLLAAHLTGPQAHMVAAVHTEQRPPQADWQQCPLTQAPDWQSLSPTQAPPRACRTVAQRFFWQVIPVGHWAVAVTQAPWALQVEVLSEPSPPQDAALQVEPTASRWQPPLPLHPLLQASSLQVPVGSAPPLGTLVQVPREPSRAHD
jgi:hypothetical protein